MASPSIGGAALGPFFDRTHCGGRYQFHRQQTRLSGEAGLIHFGEQWAEWDWNQLSIADFNTLRTLWQAEPGTFGLWSDDEKATAVSFTSGAMLEPKHGQRLGSEYFESVHVEFRMLMPLQA